MTEEVQIKQSLQYCETEIRKCEAEVRKIREKLTLLEQIDEKLLNMKRKFETSQAESIKTVERFYGMEHNQRIANAVSKKMNIILTGAKAESASDSMAASQRVIRNKIEAANRELDSLNTKISNLQKSAYYYRKQLESICAG